MPLSTFPGAVVDQKSPSQIGLKSSIILSAVTNVFSTSLSVFYIKYSMWESHKHILICALIITDLMYLIEIRLQYRLVGTKEPKSDQHVM